MSVNRIGTNLAGDSGLGNDRGGIVLSGSGSINNVIQDNVVAHSGNEGIAFFDSASDNWVYYNTIRNNTLAGIVVAGTGNSLSGNSIYENGGLYIDLGDDGVTPNDSLDADSGANNLQNQPGLFHVNPQMGGSAYVAMVGGAPASGFQIEVFYSLGCDPSGYGEGQQASSAPRRSRRTGQEMGGGGVGAVHRKPADGVHLHRDGHGQRGQHFGVLGLRRSFRVGMRGGLYGPPRLHAVQYVWNERDLYRSVPLRRMH